MRIKHAFLVTCLVISTFASATILLNDTFADGDRTNTALPNESGFWASSAGDVTTTAGNVRLDMAASSRRMHTYFAPEASPVSLGVGEKLVATIDFIPEVGFIDTTSRNFRLGLFYDPVQMAQDGVGDAGISNGWTDATGFNAQFSLSSSDVAANARVGKRTNLTGGINLLGSDSAYTYGSNGTKATYLSLDTVYTIMMMIDYQAANAMEITFEFSQGDTLISSASLIDDGTFGGQGMYTDFDFLMFRLSSNNGTAEVVNFQSITVEHIVPEPATMVLLGLGALISLKKRS
ncbi:MAG: PEP-CTERM sorting domain-containing protein [Planctomycetaceae bacterium]|nr:PEP-CTERM sorting domain-containing protein [Planctomycetaceae bacterium]